ncbi:polysaccharide pyruvyl transferase family protein [Microbacterium sp. P05]|uniref:polysaccharide pyruvyl transferase family protein n=1 Tax=Microbacterium sp. P05 TaxID=3366948 RepID=UPI003745C3EB
MSEEARQVFVSAVGQDTNVGDSVLRRGYLDALRQVGRLNVLLDGTSSDYRDGLGLTNDDNIFDARELWWRESAAQAESSPIVVAFNAGEMQLNRTFALSYARHARLILAARRAGGYGVHVGMGIRRSSAWGKPIGVILRTCARVSWRDPMSREWAGVGDVAPDWAFALGEGAPSLASEGGREFLAVCLRGDRQIPDPEWVANVEKTAQELGLRPLLVVQVERDNRLAAELAAERGWLADHWYGGPHSLRERQIRALYAESGAVLSDRLHALVIAATEGAVPIAYAPSSTEKARRTLAPAGLADFYIPVGAKPFEVVERASGLVSRASEVNQLVASAKDKLARLARSLSI